MEKTYHWTLNSWGSAYPPENVDEIIDRANEILDQYALAHGDELALEFSEVLWDKYCSEGDFFSTDEDDAVPTEYAALRTRAVDSGAAEDLAALGEWFQANGSCYWNGEYFDADDGLRLFPIYQENEDGDIEIAGYEFR